MITPTASQNEVIKCTYESGTTVKVVAGPGSGKTLTLMLKVRELVSKGIVRADEILILSLTNKAVDNVMHKLWDIFSELDSKQDEESQKATADLISQIGVYTIHGLANRVVVENEGLINIIEENGWRGLLKLIPPNLLKKYTQHRRQGVLTPKLFERLFREYQTRGGNKIEDNVMEQIMKLMKGSKVVTNEELILLAVQYLQPRPEDSPEDPSVDPTTFTQSLLHKHKVVIIDEFQDLFPSLVPLIKAISQNKQLLLFGDPYQSIYEFLGDNKAAMRSLEGMRSSKNLKTFHLYDNFRSTPEITTCANSVIRDDIRSSVPGDGNQFYSKPRMGFPYQMLISTDPIEELEIITDKICQLVSNSVRLSDIAILTRTNAQLKAVSDHLNSYGIPSEKLTSQPDWMSDQNIKFLIDLLKASVLVASDNASDKGNLNFRNRSDFSVILTVSALKGVSNQSIQALYSGAQKMGVSLWEFISQCDDWPAEVTNKTKLKSYVRHMIPMIKHVASNEQIEPISVISQLVETAYNIGYMPNELKTTEEIETFRTHLLNMLSVLKASFCIYQTILYLSCRMVFRNLARPRYVF